MIFERIRNDLRLAKIALREAVFVDDADAVLAQISEIHFQRRGVHGDQCVNRVAGRVDVAGGELKLEAAHAGEGSGRGANFSGVVGKSREVVAVERDSIRELAAGDLHAVAGIAAEPDYRAVNNLFFSFIGIRERYSCQGRHDSPGLYDFSCVLSAGGCRRASHDSMLPMRRVRAGMLLEKCQGAGTSDKLRSKFSPVQPASSLIKIAQWWGSRAPDWGALTQGLWPAFS